MTPILILRLSFPVNISLIKTYLRVLSSTVTVRSTCSLFAYFTYLQEESIVLRWMRSTLSLDNMCTSPNTYVLNRNLAHSNTSIISMNVSGWPVIFHIPTFVESSLGTSRMAVSIPSLVLFTVHYVMQSNQKDSPSNVFNVCLRRLFKERSIYSLTAYVHWHLGRWFRERLKGTSRSWPSLKVYHQYWADRRGSHSSVFTDHCQYQAEWRGGATSSSVATRTWKSHSNDNGHGICGEVSLIADRFWRRGFVLVYHRTIPKKMSGRSDASWSRWWSIPFYFIHRTMIHPCNSSASFSSSVVWPVQWSMDFLSVSNNCFPRSNVIFISNVCIVCWNKSFINIECPSPNSSNSWTIISMISWRTCFNFNQRNVSLCNPQSNIHSSACIRFKVRLRTLPLNLALASLVLRSHRYVWMISFVCVRNWTSNVADGFPLWKNGVSWNWLYIRSRSHRWI